jgi:membrane carboxypeptidase/penicillin-binding protein PbpC
LTTNFFLIFPNVSDLKRKNPSRAALMEYREEEWKVKKEHPKILQTLVPLSKISPYLVSAVRIAGDEKFWTHKGSDYDSIEKAIGKDIQAGKFKFGGRIISQQHPPGSREASRYPSQSQEI